MPSWTRPAARSSHSPEEPRMPASPGRRLPVLSPRQWIAALRKLGVTPVREKGSHVIYDIAGYRDRYRGMPYVVDTNWGGISRSDVRRILECLGLTEEDLMRVLE